VCSRARSLRQSDPPRARFKYQVYQTDLHGDVKERKKKRKRAQSVMAFSRFVAHAID